MEQLKVLSKLFAGRLPAHVVVNMTLQVLLRLIQILLEKNLIKDQDVESLCDTARSSMEWSIKNP